MPPFIWIRSRRFIHDDARRIPPYWSDVAASKSFPEEFPRESASSSRKKERRPLPLGSCDPHVVDTVRGGCAQPLRLLLVSCIKTPFLIL
jgi:hypothetical protein